MNGREIEWSLKDLVGETDYAFSKLRVLCMDPASEIALGPEFIARANDWIRRIAKAKEDPFTLVVVGEFNRGKSMLINALLGETVAPVDVTPETATINRISYGTHENRAVLFGGRRMCLADEELRREALLKEIAETDASVRELELLRPIEILREVTIVDTPGLNEALRDYAPLVEEYLLQADAVIYVTSAGMPLSASEQLFIKAAILPQKYTSLFVVGNKADLLEDNEELGRLKEYCDDKIQKLLPNREVRMVSALDEIRRQSGKRLPNEALSPILQAEFDCLRQEFTELLGSRKEWVLTDRVLRLNRSMIREMASDLKVIESGLSMTSEETLKQKDMLSAKKAELIAEEAASEHEMRKKIRTMREEAAGWMEKFVDRMVEALGETPAASAEDFLKYYECYSVDLFQEALRRCQEEHREQLYDWLEEKSRRLGKEIARVVPDEYAGGLRVAIDNRVWTRADTVALYGDLYGNLFAARQGLLERVVGTATQVAYVIAGHLRGQGREETAKDMKEEARRELQAIREEILGVLERQYASLENKAEEILKGFFGAQIGDAERRTELAAAMADKQEEEKKSIEAVVTRYRDILADMEKWVL